MTDPTEGWGDARDASGHVSRRSHYFGPCAAEDELRRSLCTKAHRMVDDARLGPLAAHAATECRVCQSQLTWMAERADLLKLIAAGSVRFRRGGPSWAYALDLAGAPGTRVTARVARVIEAGLATRGESRLGRGYVTLTPAGYEAMNHGS